MENKVQDLMVKMRLQYSNIISHPCPQSPCKDCHYYSDSQLTDRKTCALSEFYMMMNDLFKELGEE